MAAAHGNLGLIYSLGDLDRAEAMHRKSLAIEEQLGRRQGMAAARTQAIHRRALELDEQLGR